MRGLTVLIDTLLHGIKKELQVGGIAEEKVIGRGVDVAGAVFGGLEVVRTPLEGEGSVDLFTGDPFPDYSVEQVMDYDLFANG